MLKSQTIIVSNRLPITITKSGNKLSYVASGGGLATAMSSLDSSKGSIWVGWPGIASEDLTATDKQAIRKELLSRNLYPVFLTKKQIELYYDGYSNATIWPLFHYFQSLTVHEADYWAEYEKVNKLFQAAVLKYASDDSTIWVHDYQLMVLPKLLREELPDSSIGFFLHIPFPSYEIYRLLPERREIVEGLLGADLVGFHTYDYARHFLSAVLRTLGLDNQMSSVVVGDRIVRADVFPIGIDYDKFAAASKSAPVKTEIASLKKHFQDQKIVLSVDRLDYSKGILHRIEAFDRFLEKNTRWRKKIVLVVVAVPSRIDVDAYQNLREELERTIGRVNGKYATVEWTPINYQFKNLPFEELIALYARADIALVTPVRDGMNLVAKEYIASKQNRSGVLIISEMAGVADELPEAIRVNPTDHDGLVRAIEQALKMTPTDQKRRLAIMQNRLSIYNVKRWGQDFIEQLSSARKRRSAHDVNLVEPEAMIDIILQYRSAKKRLFMLDYDGTLTNFVKDIRPLSSKPTSKLMRILKKLTRTPGNDIVIVSGRPKKALESWFSKLPIGLIAEHGAFMRENGKWTARSKFSPSWKDGVRPILQIATERTPGAFIEDKHFALVWHYRNVVPELAYVRKASLKHDVEKLIHDSDIEMFQGNKIIEFKPSFITKGAAAKEKLGEGGYDFVLAIGDDYTDEDMFAALPSNAISIKVGLSASRAKYHLASVADVHTFISLLANALDDSDTKPAPKL